MKWKSDNLKSVVITDFGISRISEKEENEYNSMGTAGWTSPEQWLDDCMKER